MKGIWKEILGQEAGVGHNPNPAQTGPGIGQILGMRLSDLAKRNIALQIYSEVLGCEIWLCGNDEMANQLREDDPATTVYTANEMRRLMSSNPDPQCLINIHIAKAIFPGSKIIDSRLKEPSDESEDV